MTKPLVSIIVPIYKVEPYLQRCLDSLINQTYTNLEIILVDDGSPDNCPQICDEYAANDSRVIVIHKENGGLSDARNAGLDICSGEYISFVDSDDWVENEYIDRLLYKLLATNSDIAVANHQTFSTSNVFFPIDFLKDGVFLNTEILDNIFTTRNQFKIAWGKLFKKELFFNIRFPKGLNHEDEYVGFIPYFYAKKIVCFNQVLYHYLKRNDSITGSENHFDDYESKIVQAKFSINNNVPQLAKRLLLSLSKFYLNKLYESRNDPENNTIYKSRLQQILEILKANFKKNFFIIALDFVCKYPQIYFSYKKFFRNIQV